MPTTTWKLGKVRMPLVSPAFLESAEHWNGILGLIELFVNGIIDDSEIHGGVGLSNIVNSLTKSSEECQVSKPPVKCWIYRLHYDIDNPDNRTWENSNDKLVCINLNNSNLWTSSKNITDFVGAFNATYDDFIYQLIHIGENHLDWLYNTLYPDIKDRYFKLYQQELSNNLVNLFTTVEFQMELDLL